MCLYSRKRDGITWETFFIKEAFTKGYKGSPQGADGKRVGSGAGGIRRARRVKQAVRACLPGGRGNQNSSGARFAQGMRESVLVTDRNRLYHGGQLLLPKRDEPMEGRPEATTPPKSAPTPLGVTFPGGMPGGWGVQGGGGRRGVLAYPVLCSLKSAFSLSYSLTGLIVRFRAHKT